MASFLEQIAYEATLKEKEGPMMRKGVKRMEEYDAGSLDRLRE